MDRFIGRFLRYVVDERHGSTNTALAYRNDIEQLERFISTKRNQAKIDWDQIGRKTIEDYLEHLRNNGRAASTIARRTASIKGFFQYLWLHGVVQNDPSQELNPPRIERALPVELTVEEIALLLQAPLKYSTPEAVRDHAIMELLYATGIRISELVQLNVNDLDLELLQINVAGKNQYSRCLLIPTQVAKAINDYLVDARGILVKAMSRELALFVSRRGERMTRQGISFNVKRYAKEAGIEKPVTSFTLRQSFGTHKIRDGVNLNMVRQLLDHSRLVTTKRYVQIVQQGSSSS